jgi:hypothetical protein
MQVTKQSAKKKQQSFLSSVRRRKEVSKNNSLAILRTENFDRRKTEIY